MNYAQMIALQKETLKRYEDRPAGHWADQNQYLLTATLLQIAISLEAMAEASKYIGGRA